nr:uncharacterized protein LOC127314900 isoform X2 [Lolium perenne]
MSSSLKGWPRCHPHQQRSPTCSRRTPHHAQRPPRWLNSGWMLDVAHAPDSIGLSQLLPQALLDFFGFICFTVLVGDFFGFIDFSLCGHYPAPPSIEKSSILHF